MNVNMQSVMKAAAIGAIVNGILAVIGGGVGYALPAVGFITALFSCCGWLLIPVTVGALYGYFTPGKENIQQAAIGGAISGAVSGIAYGIISAIMAIILLVVAGAEITDALINGGGAGIGYCCAAVFAGLILGAIGGAVWTAVQKDK